MKNLNYVLLFLLSSLYSPEIFYLIFCYLGILWHHMRYVIERKVYLLPYLKKYRWHHCVKMSKYGVFSVPYFPEFGLNTERYSVSLRIQSEVEKIRTRKNSVFGHFSRSARASKLTARTAFLEVLSTYSRDTVTSPIFLFLTFVPVILPLKYCTVNSWLWKSSNYIIQNFSFKYCFPWHYLNYLIIPFLKWTLIIYVLVP